MEAAERLDELLDGRRPPETLQDRLDLAKANRERMCPPFDPGFWASCRADLLRAGFAPEDTDQLIENIRAQVGRGDPPRILERENERCSVA